MLKTNKISKKILRALILVLAFGLVCGALSFAVSAAESSEANHSITIGSTTYEITHGNLKSLADADMALLRWEAMGSENTEAVSGIFNGKTYSGYEAVYEELYKLLLANATQTVGNNNKIFSGETSLTQSDVKIIKIDKTASLDYLVALQSSETVIIVAEESATLSLGYSKVNSKVNSGCFQIEREAASVIIQGRSNENRIVVDGNSTYRSGKPFIINRGGSAYFNYAVLQNFKYGGDEKDDSVIDFPSDTSDTSYKDRSRYLYMSHSTMQDIEGKVSPGIFLRAYPLNANKESKVYLYDNLFTKCITTAGDDYAGGPVIRTYAADASDLRMEKCKVTDNHNYNNKGKTSGGGAIFWKSAVGKATLVDCEFTNNTSAQSGGAIYNVGNMEVQNCLFQNNSATKNGGAIVVEPPNTSSSYSSIKVNNISGSLVLDEDTRILENTAGEHGGAIYFYPYEAKIGNVAIPNGYRMMLEINGSTIKNNTATNGNGGAIAINLNYGKKEFITGVNISSGNITGNKAAKGNGGAIWMNSTDSCECNGNIGVTMSGGVMENNHAMDGGAVYISAGKTLSNGEKFPNAMSFKLTGGTIKDNASTQNGGAVYMTDGTMVLSGGTVSENKATINGGAVYLGGGTLMVNGGSLSNNNAKTDGGAVYMTAGTMALESGTVSGNEAKSNGGGVYLGGGTLTVSGGSLLKNSAEAAGGAVYMTAGTMELSGGTVSENKATGNGGGIAVYNGNYEMTGGNVDKNSALSGSGGGIYASAQGSNVNVMVYSGSVSDNAASVSGGALAVVGDAESTAEKIDVQIGINKLHFDTDGKPVPCGHPDAHIQDCPVMKGNSSVVSGGAVYVTGNDSTSLSIYCLTEGGSTAQGESGQSNFMKVEGGKVLISTSETEDPETQTSIHGNSFIENTIYVTGGKVDLYGDMKNAEILGEITVDIMDADDYFHDYRKVNSYYKLIYFENFTDPETGVKTGQYKEQSIVIKDGVANVTIIGNIYSHPGYTISGWNTQPDGSGDKYEVGTTHNLTADLTIYAIWNANGYNVKFDPNVPVGESYGGTMGDMGFQYNVAQNLPLNAYTRPGYEFEGWATSPDGKKVYNDGQSVTNLTDEKGVEVTLYAKWIPCTHDESSHTYTYSVTDGGATLKRDCSCGGYSETASLTASDVVYDKAGHPASVAYSSAWEPEVSYTKDGAAFVGVPTNAGTYVASVSGGDKAASVTYTIEKAEQPAPEKPKYDSVLKVDGSVLSVKPVAESSLKASDETYDSVRQYRLVYYIGETEYAGEWNAADTSLSDGYAAQFTLDKALTNYYIQARYSEGTNYKASPESTADSVYFFVGEVEFLVICGEGVLYTIETAAGTDVTQNGIRVKIQTKDGYYFPSDYRASVSTEHNLGGKAILSPADFSEVYDISSIPNNSKVTLTLPDAKKYARTALRVTEGQVFGNVTDHTAIISRDSAFTAYAEVENYDATVYSNLCMNFSPALPKGTKLILLDKGAQIYYHKTLDSAASTLDLGDFVQMGTENTKFVPQSGDLKLQLVVDFSGVGSPLDGDKLTLALKADKSDAKAGSVDASCSVSLKNVPSFALNVNSGNHLKHTYTPSDGTASALDGCHSALVLTPTDGTVIPADAYLSVASNGMTATFYRNSDGNFVIPLSEPKSGTMALSLVSGLFTDADYTFGVSWYIAHSKAESSPMNGDVKASVDITLKGVKSPLPSVKIVTLRDGNDNSANAQWVYTTGNNAIVKVSWLDMQEHYKKEVVLMRKAENGIYTSTGWTQEVTASDSVLTVPLNLAGSYCLQLNVETGLIKVTDAKFYFVVK